jgi:hypothetical protein
MPKVVYQENTQNIEDIGRAVKIGRGRPKKECGLE